MKISPASSNVPIYTISDFSADEISEDSSNFRITNLNEYIVNEDRRDTPIKLDHFTIALTIDGKTNIQLNLINHICVANSLVIVPPNIYLELKERNKDLKVLIMSFTEDFLLAAGMHRKKAEIFNSAAWQNCPHFSLTDNEAKILKASMCSMKKNYKSKEFHFYKSEVLHHEFNVFLFELASILLKYNIHSPTKHKRKDDILNMFTELLSIHFKEERSVRYYADAMFITSNHLSKTIKELTNKPCRELIDAMVIIEAKILLDDISLSVSNVAELLHFSDQFFFSKFFKNNTGLNPSQYKNRIQINNNAIKAQDNRIE